MIESRMATVPALVERMAREDREFITAYTVAMFSTCSRPEAALALTRLGYTPEQIGTLEVDGMNCQLRHGPLPVIVGERVFTVIPGRRWTKVPEYMSNGQLTARFFVDESSGEVRAQPSRGRSRRPGRSAPAMPPGCARSSRRRAVADERYTVRRARALWLVIDTRRDEAIGDALPEEIARALCERLEREWRTEVSELIAGSWRSW